MFEVVQTLLSFGGFTIALVGLCYKIFKDDKKQSVPTFERVGRIISVV
ncbi:putative holin-like toxin [Streptococcus suis]|nr:putative holin-like toxin [Streptococcus suis]